MKRLLLMCIVALVIGVPSTAYLLIGVGKGGVAEFEKELRKGTVIIRAKGQLADTEKSRTSLKNMADEFEVQSMVALAKIGELEEAKEQVAKEFEKLANIAQNAGLPERDQATEAHRIQAIQIGTRTFTGTEVYNELDKYRGQVKEANVHLERGRKESEMYKNRAEQIRTQMPSMDDKIVAMKHHIADLEMYKKFLEANKKLGLEQDKIEELMRTDGIMAELRNEVHETEARLKLSDTKSTGGSIAVELNRSTSPVSTFSIDDLR